MTEPIHPSTLATQILHDYFLTHAASSEKPDHIIVAQAYLDLLNNAESSCDCDGHEDCRDDSQREPERDESRD